MIVLVTALVGQSLLLGQVKPINPAVEYLEPTASEVSIQAIIKLPPTLTPAERDLLPALALAIPEGTREYPRKAILTTTNGVPVKCQVMPDSFRICIDVPPANLGSGLGLIESLSFRAALRDEDLNAAAQSVPPHDYWWRALWTTQPGTERFEPDSARNLYSRLFRPQNVTLAVGGKFTPGEVTTIWGKRIRSLEIDPPEAVSGHDYSKQQMYAGNVDGISTIDFSEPLPIDGKFNAKLLSLFALGSGKGSSLFRVVREGMGISYRQEGVLWPGPDGFLARLLIASAGKPPTSETEVAIRKGLLADIDGWTESHRGRALGMASSVLLRGNRYGPMYLCADGPGDSILDSRTFEAGYWKMKTGQDWDPDRILNDLGQVSLDELKAGAREIVGGSVRILSGSKQT